MRLTSNYLSALRINTDKNWLSYNITNLGRGNIDLGVNQPLSPGIYVEDIGKNWKDLGAISSTVAYMKACGSGIVLFGDGNGHVLRSINYGATWTDLGQIISDVTPVSDIAYCGSGVVVIGGSNNKRIYRSVNYGATWTDLGDVVSTGIFSMVYCGNGIVLAGDYDNHIFRSTDYGLNWTDLGIIGNAIIRCLVYCGDGIVVFGTDNKHLFRSTDYGVTWSDLDEIATDHAFRLVYCGNGIVLFGDENTHIFRSTDYGATWADLGSFTSNYIRSMTYCSNGVVLMGDGDYHIYRSEDYGLTWSDLGVIGTHTISALAYCDNGVALFCNWLGHVFRSDPPFKSAEFASNSIARPVNSMDFWSDIDDAIALPADTALPNIVVADLPSGAAPTRAILMLKYSSKKDTSGFDNKITAGKIQSKETTGGTYVDAINLIAGEASVDADTKEAGDVHIGDNDISGTTSGIIDNCTVQSVFSGVTTTGASVVLYDVQLGIRIYFT